MAVAKVPLSPGHQCATLQGDVEETFLGLEVSRRTWLNESLVASIPSTSTGNASKMLLQTCAQPKESQTIRTCSTANQLVLRRKLLVGTCTMQSQALRSGEMLPTRMNIFTRLTTCMFRAWVKFSTFGRQDSKKTVH